MPETVNTVESFRKLLKRADYLQVKNLTCSHGFGRGLTGQKIDFSPDSKTMLEVLFDDIACIACLGRTLADIDIEKNMTREERVAFAEQAFLTIKEKMPGATPEEIEKNAESIFASLVSNASKTKTMTGFAEYSIPKDALKNVLQYRGASRK